MYPCMLRQFCTHREHRTNYCLSAPQGGASSLDSAPLRRGLFHVNLFAQEGEQVSSTDDGPRPRKYASADYRLAEVSRWVKS